MEADASGGGCALSEHVTRHVDTVDIEPRLDEGHQQPSRPARQIERRLTGLDVLAKEVDLRAAGGELRPPTRHQAVVPRLYTLHNHRVCTHAGVQSFAIPGPTIALCVRPTPVQKRRFGGSPDADAERSCPTMRTLRTASGIAADPAI